MSPFQGEEAGSIPVSCSRIFRKLLNVNLTAFGILDYLYFVEGYIFYVKRSILLFF